jgi:hypothetical protein
MAVFIYLFGFFLVSAGPAQDPVLMNKKERKFIESAFPGEVRVSEVDLGSPDSTDLGAYRPGDRVLLIGQQDDPRGYLLSTSAMGRYEPFDYLIAFAPEFDVLDVIVTSYRSSHGAAICQKKWLRQFAGYSGEELRLGKEINSISGATISAGSMVKDMGRCHRLMQSLRKKGLIL